MKNTTKKTIGKLATLADTTMQQARAIEGFEKDGDLSDTFFLMAYGGEGAVSINAHASTEDAIDIIVALMRSFPIEKQKPMLMDLFHALSSSSLKQVPDSAKS